jgi:hypothetical protein
MVMVLVVPVEEGAAEASGILDAAEAFGKARLILQGLDMGFVEGCYRLVPHAVNFDPIFSDHAASGFPVLVHLNGFAMVRLK